MILRGGEKKEDDQQTPLMFRQIRKQEKSRQECLDKNLEKEKKP